MSFLDAYRGYHQIAMNTADKEKTSFITLLGLYCYRVILFGLRNAGATYQRLVMSMFKDQLGKSMEAYIDDMVVKSSESKTHLDDLKRTFDVLRKYQLKLNTAKCVFGVSSGKFLGHLVARRGIEVDPDQITTLQSLQSPRMTKEVQKMMGMIAALNQFVSRSLDKCRPFFRLLRKMDVYTWG